MGKPANKRRLPENEALAVGRMIRISPQKLNLVAQLIRGKKAETALADLTADERQALERTIAKIEQRVVGALVPEDTDEDEE